MRWYAAAWRNDHEVLEKPSFVVPERDVFRAARA
jgi:hypothetical protein